MEFRKSRDDDDETTREASLSSPEPLFFHQTISSTSTLTNHGPIRTVAVCGRNIYAGSDTGTIQAWRLLPGPELSEYGEMRCKGHQVKAVAVSGDHVFAACADGKIRVWCRSLETLPEHARIGTIPKFGDFIRSYVGGKHLQMTNHFGGITSLAIHDSDDLLYSASLDSTVKVWRISDLRCIETIRAHAGPVNAIVVGEDGILYTGSNDATVKVWRRITCGGDQQLSLIVSLPTRDSPAKALALASDDMVLYVGCTDGCVYSYSKGWLPGHIQYTGALLGHNHAIMCLACVSNYVASGSADWTCRVWAREAVDHHTCLAVLHGHQGPITGVALFSIGGVDDDGEDGCTVCTGSIDGVLKIWQVTRLGNMGQVHQKALESDMNSYSD
ncbi:hypothetical protein AAC387_Pa02g2601 [Persea americana]